MNNIFDDKRRNQIFGSFKTKEVEKAYTEGIYADTPANRKLGRVGMPYSKKGEIAPPDTLANKKSSNIDVSSSNKEENKSETFKTSQNDILTIDGDKITVKNKFGDVYEGKIDPSGKISTKSRLGLQYLVRAYDEYKDSK